MVNKKRKYNDNYLSLGFTVIRNNNIYKRRCVVCLKLLSNELLTPSKLRRHLETNHPKLKSLINLEKQFIRYIP